MQRMFVIFLMGVALFFGPRPASAESFTCGQVFTDGTTHVIDYFSEIDCSGVSPGFTVQNDTKVIFLESPVGLRSTIKSNGSGNGALLSGRSYLKGPNMRNWERGAYIIDAGGGPTNGTVEFSSFVDNDYGVYYQTNLANSVARINDNALNLSRKTGIMVSGPGNTVPGELYIKNNRVLNTLTDGETFEDAGIVLRHTMNGEVTDNDVEKQQLSATAAYGVMLYNTRSSFLAGGYLLDHGVLLFHSDQNTISNVDIEGFGFDFIESPSNLLQDSCSRVRVCHPQEGCNTHGPRFNVFFHQNSHSNTAQRMFVENIQLDPSAMGAHAEAQVNSPGNLALQFFRGPEDLHSQLEIWNDASSPFAFTSETFTQQGCSM
jgi:hypothetical protein